MGALAAIRENGRNPIAQNKNILRILNGLDY
jgi:hypothetical protein